MVIAGVDHGSRGCNSGPGSASPAIEFMPEWNVVRDSAYDRRHAAVHEAGHFVVAVHFGLRDLGA